MGLVASPTHDWAYLRVAGMQYPKVKRRPMLRASLVT